MAADNMVADDMVVGGTVVDGMVVGDMDLAADFPGSWDQYRCHSPQRTAGIAVAAVD